MDDRSLTDSWVFDEGSEVQGFDAETLLNTIMLKGMSFEPLFTDPRFYYVMNHQWWNKWKGVFDKWFVVLEKEYEPLWDRNGYEEVHEDTVDTGTLDTATSGRKTIDNDTTGTKSATEVVDDDTTYSGTSQTIEQASGKDKTTHDSDRDISVSNNISAYDAPSNNPMVPHDSSHTDDTLNSETTETTYGKKVQTDGTESGSGTDDKTTTYNESTSGTDDTTEVTSGTIDTDTTGDRDFDRSYHSWGNWGISQTSQKLLMAELQTRYWNIYEHIADIFLDEMTVGVF